MEITFKDLNLMPEVAKALDQMGFLVPTEIQAKVIPLLLSKPKMDLHGQAQTGTGKTLGFGIPILHRIDKKNRRTQALIIAPTRELALQICDSIRPLADAVGISIEAIYGGASIDAQIRSLRKGIHIVVGTPGRLNDHLRRKTLMLDSIHTLALDEADIMLDMGFRDEIDEILSCMPQDREIWLFSATVKSGIHDIMMKHMKNTESVRISRKQVITATTKHYYCTVPSRARLNALCRFIESASHFYGFVFCQTKILTSEIAEQLLLRGYRVGAIHGDMSQSQRNAVINRFKGKDITILVATDVAARGIDIANVTHVINHSLSDDPESYVHRTGRTGRAGRDGIAITFINRSEIRHIFNLQKKFSLTIQPIDVPTREIIINARMQEVREYVDSVIVRTAPEEQALSVLITNLTEAQKQNALQQILFDRFLKSIYEEEEFAGTSLLSPEHAEKRVMHGGVMGDTQEIFIPIGTDDGLTHESLTKIFEENKVPLDLILKFRVIKKRTFIHIMRDSVETVNEAIKKVSFQGRKLRPVFIEASHQQQAPRWSNNGGGGRNQQNRYRSHDRKSSYSSRK